jgi:hypothetical protein
VSFRPLLAVGTAACLAAVSCTSEDGDTAERIRLDGEKIHRSQREQLLRMRVARLSVPADELAELRNRIESQRACIATLEERRAGLNHEATGLEHRKTALRNECLRQVRDRLAGRKFSELTLPDGRSYKQVAVIAATDAGLHIRHASGTARLTINDLGVERGEAFGIDATSSQATLIEEASHQREYERWVGKELASQAGAVRNPTRLVKRGSAPPSPRSVAPNLGSAPPSNPLREKPRYFGGVRSAPRYRTYYQVYTLYPTAPFFSYSPYTAPVSPGRESSTVFPRNFVP